ncbi:unnamed protein product [Clonostachys rosea]|uniref:Uncharacterized protein n=1 Tax=Bionectria ochroleuca TaxID=29856 RepID=A0ABY6U4G5_BIOOC|nr:unnamed protein product [Clonostachys rosea]
MATQVHTVLSPIDHIPPRNYVKSIAYLLLKPGVSNKKVFEVLQEGLHRTFLQLPWLSGKVHWQSPDTLGWRPGQLEIRHTRPDVDGPLPHYQLKFNELDTDITFDELRESEFPLDSFNDDDLLWAEFLPDLENGAEVFVAQANFIKDACLLSTAVHHSATDGMGSAMIPRLWADNCKNLHNVDRVTAASAIPVPPKCYDRSLMRKILVNEGDDRSVEQIDSKTWQLLDMQPPVQGAESEVVEDDQKGGPRSKPTREMRSNIFYISPKDWDTLKKLSTDSGHEGQISGTDALYAFLWRAIIKARAAANPDDVTPGTESCLELAIDLRPDFSSTGDMPPMYLGNCILHNVISRPVSSLTASADQVALSDIAGEIRDTVARFTPQGIHDAYTLLEKAGDYRQCKLRFTRTEGHDMMISSWLMFPVDKVIFGDSVFQNGGRVESMRPMMSGFNRYFRMCFLLPKLASGGVEFVVSLYEDEMDKLMEDTEFGKYASFCS